MNSAALPVLFGLVWMAFWFGITGLIGSMSGWNALAQRYPDRGEQLANETFRFQSAAMGRGDAVPRANFGGCVRFDVCSSGLRVRVWRIFLPFSRPFFVPWNDIAASVYRPLGLRFRSLERVKLEFSRPAAGSMLVTPRLARRIADASHGSLKLPTDS